MKKPLVIHPFLFAVFPILFLFAHNIGQVRFSQTLLPSAIMLGFTFLLLLLSRLILGNYKKAGIVVSIFLVLFFFYGHVFNVTPAWLKGSFGIDRHTYLVLLWYMVFICGAYFIKKTRRDLHNFTNILNVVATFLVVISLINIGAYELKTKPWRSIKRTKNIKINTIDSRRADTLPDIYYIILDRYASTSTLKEFYDFDNSKFIDYLFNRGFYVAQSRSNYLKTAHSLASSFNMEYINYLSDKMGEESGNWKPLVEMLQDYKVWRFLKSRGYKFIHFGSWWEATRRNKYADMNFNLFSLPEFSMSLYKTTVLYPFIAKLGISDKRLLQWIGDERLVQYKRVLYKFKKLAEISNIKEPTFVFAHMLTPHAPFVFDRDGNFLTEEEDRKRSRIQNYVNQLIFVNKKIEILIDKLLSNSQVPPIIILQADEGPYPPGRSTDWEQMSKAELRQKMKILNAYYLPNADKDVLYPSITPVNSFRLIFNLYFGTDFELLPDESYVHPDDHHPYKFFNVTDKLRQNNKED
jgi:hypothetical protein